MTREKLTQPPRCVKAGVFDILVALPAAWRIA
jgi:hypothetical protein